MENLYLSHDHFDVFYRGLVLEVVVHFGFIDLFVKHLLHITGPCESQILPRDAVPNRVILKGRPA